MHPHIPQTFHKTNVDTGIGITKGYTTGSYYQRLEDQPAKYDETRSQGVVKEFFLNSSRACKAKCWKRGVQALVREVFRSVVFRLLEWACGWELWVLFWLWADVLVLYCVTYFPISMERFTCTNAYQTHKVLCIYVRGDTDTIGNTLTEIQNNRKNKSFISIPINYLSMYNRMYIFTDFQKKYE